MRIVKAGNGLLWLRQGWALFRRHPADWIILMMLFLLVSAAINWIPLIGPFIASALIPGLSAGLMRACADADAGGEVRPAALFSGFLEKPGAMLRLGALYLAAMLLTLTASSPVDGGILMKQMLFGTPPAEDAIKDGSYINALALSGLLATPVLMCFWFAPMLVAQASLGTSQSLFYSFFASLRNWRAFGMYGLFLFGGIMTASMTLAVAGVSLGANLGMLRGLMLMLVIILMPSVTCSFYCSYMDIFPPQADNQESEPVQ